MMFLNQKTEAQLKKDLNEASSLANKHWQEIPGGLDFAQYEAKVEEIYKDVNRLSSEYRLIQTPKLKEAGEFELECLMTFEEFKDCCESGGFIDYDGSGRYGNATHESNIPIYPSDIMSGEFRNDFTHVYWYNK